MSQPSLVSTTPVVLDQVSGRANARPDHSRSRDSRSTRAIPLLRGEIEMKHAKTLALTLAAAAGTASAQLSYTQNDTARAGYRTRAVFDGSPSYTPPTTYWAQDLGGLFTESLQEFSYSSPLNLADYPQIRSVTQDYSVRTQASETRFEYSWNGVSQLETSGEIVNPDQYLAALSISANLSVHVEQATQLRFSWSGSGGGALSTDKVDGLNNHTVITVTSENGTITGFTAGFGNNDATINQPFSFVLDVAAGEQINLNFSVAFLNRNLDGSSTMTGWDQFQNSSFVIEVVPAPSALALLGLTGLCATRRRRR